MGKLHEAIASIAAQPKLDGAEEEHILEQFHSSRTIRKLVLDCPEFASTLWEKALRGKCATWVKGHRLEPLIKSFPWLAIFLSLSNFLISFHHSIYLQFEGNQCILGNLKLCHKGVGQRRTAALHREWWSEFTCSRMSVYKGWISKAHEQGNVSLRNHEITKLAGDNALKFTAESVLRAVPAPSNQFSLCHVLGEEKIL